MPATPTVSMCPQNISERPGARPSSVPTTLGRPGATSWTSTVEADARASPRRAPAPRRPRPRRPARATGSRNRWRPGASAESTVASTHKSILAPSHLRTLPHPRTYFLPSCIVCSVVAFSHWVSPPNWMLTCTSVSPGVAPCQCSTFGGVYSLPPAAYSLMRLTAPAGAHAARFGEDELSVVVTMPGRSSARLEATTAARDVFGLERRHDAGEVRIDAGLPRRGDGDGAEPRDENRAGQDETDVGNAHEKPPTSSVSSRWDQGTPIRSWW